MKTDRQDNSVLVLGLGNTLLSDDGIGVHVLNSVEKNAEPHQMKNLHFCEGGTLGMSLLPSIESADSLIVVDAANFNAEPGTVEVFEGRSMDEQLSGKKSSAHEVALEDLVSAAHLTGNIPERRALVAIQPETTTWGLEPGKLVSAALPIACQKVEQLIERWQK